MYLANGKPRSSYDFGNVFQPFCSLPKELLHEITAYLPVNDIVSFCLVCKEFNQLGLNILYKAIQNVSSRCFDTLACNSRNARAVKTLVLPSQVNNQVDIGCTWLGPQENVHDPSLERPSEDVKAASILPHLSGLQNLFVPSFSAIYTQSLSQCDFPNLQIFSFSMPITQPIASFISRNNSIVSLTFDCYLPFFQNCVLRPITLPQLRYLSGNPQIIKIFAQHAPLETVHIDWKYERARIAVLDDALGFLALHCCTTVKELGVHRNTFRQCTCNNQILVNISEKFPRIIKLGLNGIDISNGSIVMVNTALSRFECLKYLNLDQHPPSAVGPPRLVGSTQLDYDRDEALILSWTSDNCCSELQECQLPNGILWCLRGPKLWLPLLSTVPQRKSLLLDASKWRECRAEAAGLDIRDLL
ncbi:hypothetical protein DFH05DRAFT_945414 [Lentinula detonsa]|uniref:F-box domain-containing protein n=2 Tax=Lentinula detonsa TaxID=2804962 RepID=A0A9W8TZP5_9AGAR|nr:hypothetical protein DFH05DRAFT_945414 [Lentinula detonsa]